jgi:hypothetical protein
MSALSLIARGDNTGLNITDKNGSGIRILGGTELSNFHVRVVYLEYLIEKVS